MPPIVPPNQEKPNPLNTCIVIILAVLLSMYITKIFFPPAEVNKPQATQEEIDAPSNINVAPDPNFKEPQPTAEATVQTPASETTPVAAEASNTEAAAVAASDQTPAATVSVPEKPKWIVLGSMDDQSPYKMLLTFSSQGATLVRAELNSKRYLDLFDEQGYAYENRGYIGHVLAEVPLLNAGRGRATSAKSLEYAKQVLADRTSCEVVMVPEGTPAYSAGLRVGDVILKCNQTEIRNREDYITYMNDTQPGDKLVLTVLRNVDGQMIETALKEVELRQVPMSVIRPEGFNTIDSANQTSFLMTLQQLDGATISEQISSTSSKNNAVVLDSFLNRELASIDMRNGNWEVVESSRTKVVFKYPLPRYGLEVYKTFEVSSSTGNDNAKTADGTSTEVAGSKALKALNQHVTMTINIKNVGSLPRTLAYRLDGPTGLPLEGYWFTHKVWRTWSAVGLRDFVYKLDTNSRTELVSCQTISNDQWTPIENQPLRYTGVDAAYFGAYLIPRKQQGQQFQFSKLMPLRVSTVDPKWATRTDCSFRAYSVPELLAPNSELTHRFDVFLGPKTPAVLADYNLKGVLYYGWFGWIAVPLMSLLHFFYAIVGNYGIAILLLTALVRLLMHPLSRNQVMGALKMQKLQPEMAKIKEKYKDPQEQMKAQQALFRQHNYNPLSGCLVVLIQLPIFMALYRALMVDVELRQASVFSSSVRFCSNLAAPDMLWDWSNIVPQWVSSGYGMFGFGPYFNLFPLATIVLFLVQQKVLMPPAVDDQSRMQQKMMTFMMLFMGLFFFKIAAGLCIYFIASSLWGLAERRFMPKELIDEELVKDERKRYMPEVKRTPKPRPEDDDPREVLRSWGDGLKKLVTFKKDETPAREKTPTDRKKRKSGKKK